MTLETAIGNIYVVHALKGYDHHAHWVKNLFTKHHLDFEFMTDGDPSLFTKDLLDKYFVPNILDLWPEGKISVTLNHILCYEAMVKNQNKMALVFEDDPFFLSNFDKYFGKIVEEFSDCHTGAIVSIENSTLRFPSRKIIEKGKYLYEASSGRCAGAYLINIEGARSILRSLEQTKCPTIIDWWHNQLIKRRVVNMFWAHPPVVEQGSHNGKMQAINSIRSKGLRRRVAWTAEKLYKMHILWWFK